MKDTRQALPIKSQDSSENFWEQEAGNYVPYSLKDSTAAAWEQGMDSSIGFGKIPRYFTLPPREGVAGQKVYSAQDLNSQFPNLQEPFTGPATMMYAQTVADRQDHDRHLQEIIAKGPQDLSAKTQRVLWGLAPGLIDPATWAAGALIGTGVGAAVGGTALASSALGKAAIEGALFGAASAGAEKVVAGAEQKTYTAKDAAGEIAMGAASMAGIHAIHAGLKFGRNAAAEYIFRSGTRAETESMLAAAESLRAGKRADFDRVVQDLRGEVLGRPVEGPNGFARGTARAYDYQPIEGFEQVPGRKFYAASPEFRTGIHDSDLATIEGDYGTGIYMTDNQAIANGHAARRGNLLDGKVIETRLEERPMNLMNLEKPIGKDSPAEEVLRPFLEQVLGKERTDIILGEGTGRQLLDGLKLGMENGKLPADTMDQIGRALREKGIDGYRLEGGDHLGVKGDPHNVVMLFDPEGDRSAASLLTDPQALQADRSGVPDPKIEDLRRFAQEHQSYKNDIDYLPELESRMDEMLARADRGFEASQPVTEARARQAEFQEQLQTLREQELVPKDILDEIERISAEGVDEEKAVKMLTECFLMNGVL